MRARYAALLMLVVAGCARRPLGAGNAVLVFVSPGCPIANRYLPELERIAARFAGRVDFKLVYPEAGDEEVRTHRAAYGITIAAERDPTHKLVTWAHATVTPEAALFARRRARVARTHRRSLRRRRARAPGGDDTRSRGRDRRARRRAPAAGGASGGRLRHRAGALSY